MKTSPTIWPDLSAKPDAAQAIERLEAFWGGGSIGGRPAVGIKVLKKDYRADPFPPDCEGKGMKELDRMPEWHEWHTKFSVCRHLHLGEAMPGEYLGYGGQLALSCLLCGGDYTHEKGQPAWIREMPDVYSRPLPAFDPDHPAVRNLDISFDRAAENLRGIGFVCQPYVLEGLTLLSLFRGMDTLGLDMVDEPEAVRRYLDAVTEVNLGMLKHWYHHTADRGFGRRNICFWGPATPGACDFIQCDFAVMISPKDFNAFVMPSLERISGWLDYSLYHLDGMAQLRHLDSLASLPNLNGIQVNPEPGKESPLEWLAELREIRRRGLAIYVVCKSGDEAVLLARELGPDGLYIRVDGVVSEAEGLEIINRLGGE